jgi:hypothetical protein
VNVEFQISSNAAAIARQVKEFTPRMSVAIAAAMDQEDQLTVGKIQVSHLTAPGATKPLPPSEHRLRSISNRLRGSLNAIPAKITGNVIDAGIGSNVAYAGAHEFGFDGTVQVKAHSRRRFEVKPAPRVFNPKTGKIHATKATRTPTGDTISVKAHSMHMRMPERAPIRTGIQERAGNYSASISTAIVAAWAPEGGTTS